MAQQQATRQEQMFFRLEMRAEEASIKSLRWSRPLAMVQTTAIAEARAMVKAPAVGLVFLVQTPVGLRLQRLAASRLSLIIPLAFAGIAHGYLAGPCWLQTGFDSDRTSEWAQYVLLNAVPLPGLSELQQDLRDALFVETGGVQLAAVLLETFHKTCALIALFLTGLAVRNLFKMKG